MSLEMEKSVQQHMDLYDKINGGDFSLDCYKGYGFKNKSELMQYIVDAINEGLLKETIGGSCPYALTKKSKELLIMRIATK